MTKRKRADGKITKTGPKDNWKMTTDVITKLEAAFAIDCSIVEACAFADISHESYYRWTRESPELSARFERLKHNPILRAKDSVFKGLKGNPELALKYLKSRLPKEFGDTLQIESKSIQYHIIKLINELNNEDNPSRNKTIGEQDVPNGTSIQDKGQET